MKTNKLAKKSIAVFALFAFAVSSFGVSGFLPANVARAATTWDISGNYVINMNLDGTDYPHDWSLAQAALDDSLTGNGGSPAGANTYEYTLNPGGTVVGDTINFTANYTATPDAVTPQTVLTVAGVIAEDGTMSGTWSDNFAGGTRTGTWASTSGVAILKTVEPAPETVKVTIVKYVDGAMATTESANSTSFPMISSWDAENTGAGSGSYSLAAGNDPAYTAMTTDMSSGADYSTNEVLDTEAVGASCEVEGTNYALTGYTSGDSLAEAQAASPSLTSPTFIDMTSDKYVIVWNDDCATEDGGIGGDVVGGDGTLEVTSIDVTDSTATADGTFENGWEYVFNVTVPSDEQDVAMKFADWLRDGGGGTIPAANNIRISSAQADNGGATIMITAADTYSADLHMTGDLDLLTEGMQVEITVEVRVPSGTPNGAYSTSWGIRSN
jgi:hypothetical protein